MADSPLKDLPPEFIQAVHDELTRLQALDNVEETWTPFLGGEWTKEHPTVAGTYPVADRGGYAAGDIVVGYMKDAFWVNGEEVEDWAEVWIGWWWSEPRPDLPPAPFWGPDE